MPNEELKPCPFCGKDAQLQVGENGVAVVCTDLYECGCRTEYYKDFNCIVGWDDWKKGITAVGKAVSAWNRRQKEADNA